MVFLVFVIVSVANIQNLCPPKYLISSTFLLHVSFPGQTPDKRIERKAGTNDFIAQINYEQLQVL